MRRVPTDAEQRLWQRLRHRQLGSTFRRQFVIDRFIVDFYCAAACLVVEVDGDSHRSRRERDEDRDRRMQGMGLRILRISNERVLRDEDTVVSIIRAALLAPSR